MPKPFYMRAMKKDLDAAYDGCIEFFKELLEDSEPQTLVFKKRTDVSLLPMQKAGASRAMPETGRRDRVSFTYLSEPGAQEAFVLYRESDMTLGYGRFAFRNWQPVIDQMSVERFIEAAAGPKYDDTVLLSAVMVRLHKMSIIAAEILGQRL